MRRGSFILCLLGAGLFLPGVIFPSLASAQDITRLGGDLTTDMIPEVALQLPAPNVTDKDRFNLHIDGHAQFHTTFDLLDPTKPPAIGPLFNHTSCGGCHVNDGKGPVKFSSKGTGSAMLIKISLKGLNPDGSPKDVPGVGEQIRDHQVTGKNPYNIKLKWQKVKGKYRDGKPYQLRKPLLTFTIPDFGNTRKLATSLRMTPSIIGMGLLEAVSEETLLALADPTDQNNDGISGKVNYVNDIESQTKKVGRFGFRATHSSLIQQSAAALFHDMGVTSRLFNDTDEEPEITDLNLDKLTFYQQVAGVTAAINQDDPDVIRGKEIFQEINCSACHVMTLKVPDDYPIPELAGQEFHPFTDLLLHDMGAGLADKRREFLATGREWRTTPLWGLRLHKRLSKNKPGYMHDGRARTIEEAILWHDGEARATKNKFKALSADERAKLVKFVLSL